MTRKFGLIAGFIAISMMMLATAARADCDSDCKAGFDVCMRNCGGQSGCLATCSHGHEWCLRRCESRSMHFGPLKAITIAFSPSGNPVSNWTCERTGEGGVPASQPLALTCSSSEWCCKHDIGGTGECTKCCARP